MGKQRIVGQKYQLFKSHFYAIFARLETGTRGWLDVEVCFLMKFSAVYFTALIPTVLHKDFQEYLSNLKVN